VAYSIQPVMLALTALSFSRNEWDDVIFSSTSGCGGRESFIFMALQNDNV